MSDTKKYYWLKLKKDFFKNKRIKKLRTIAGGDTYTIIYLKMQLLSLQDDGYLLYENVEDDFESEIALEIDEEVENVRTTIAFLVRNGLIEILNDNNVYRLVETQECIGSESSSKYRVQAHRKRKNIREKIDLKYVQIISNEMIRTLTDGKIHYIDNKRYGGNAEYVYDLAMCKCENCGETNTEKFVIHHNNGYSNDLDDLYLLCPKCHRNVEVGNIVNLKHNRRKSVLNLLEYNQEDVTCNTSVTKCNTEKEKEKEIDKEKKKNKKEKYFKNEEVNNIFLEFLQLRKKIKAVNSDRAIKLLINQLEKYDDDTKIKMIEQSILNSWKSVYEIKNKSNKNETNLERLNRHMKELEEKERRLND